jgi:hypothetical protein
VPALHALQDHVVARLEGHVEVRHEARLAGDDVEQRSSISTLSIEERRRRGRSGTCRNIRSTSSPGSGFRQVGPIARDIDAGEDDFLGALIHQRLMPLHHSPAGPNGCSRGHKG